MRHEHSVHIFINKQKFELEHAVQTGAALKQLAGIPLSDVLFLQRPGDDEVIGNDAPHPPSACWARTGKRFSWHFAAGAWKPGVSSLRDLLRCVSGRFLRMD